MIFPLNRAPKLDYNRIMLNRLFISNIVLIEKLELDFGRGLSVLTGETGAGKSILLDALALALGARSDAGLVRAGCENSVVVADFKDVPFMDFLGELGIEQDGDLVLRRTLSADGKSKAFVNDVPVSLRVLKSVGDQLCEIHGQFENHTLLDPSSHIGALDEFGGYEDILEEVKEKYKQLHDAEKRLKELAELAERGVAEREFLEYNVAELKKLSPIAGEEEELASKRAQMMDAEKNSAVLNDAVTGINGIDEKIFNVAHILQRIKTEPNPYQSQIDKLYDVGNMVGEIGAEIEPKNMVDMSELEGVEERLFALRAAARKHRVTVDELAQKYEKMSSQLQAIDNSEEELTRAAKELGEKKKDFDLTGGRLSKIRKETAEKLRLEILKELPDLKLAQADFMVEIIETEPSSRGADNVIFTIKTNPGNPFAPLHKIASGGELARLMLALRVVLMGRGALKTFVFDEVDTGISGATASAVGVRLARLASNGQALVITHSAQVAGAADNHYLISKRSDDNSTTTSVKEIKGEEKINELARIISGAEITAEAIATAKTLVRCGK